MLRNKRARAGSLQRRLTGGFGVAMGLVIAALTSSAQPLSSAEQASHATPSSLTQSAQDSISNGENLMALLRHVDSELRKLRVELLEDRWEIQQAKMQDLERELQIVQNQRHQLQDEQRSETLAGG
jgi:Skp family chaperone for outer membrane proteins